MLKRGFLAGNTVYSSTVHDSRTVATYLDGMDKCFAIIAGCENGEGIDELLEGPVCHAGFARLN